MTTLLSKAQNLIQKIRSDRHDIEDWPKDSLDAFLDFEQAIAQEQRKPDRNCKTCKTFSLRDRNSCNSCDDDYSKWEPKP